ncbi:response regulator transcription factor [Aerococcaceae bacterium zg-ZJ1578]|uniref:response regulator transcription factor n=1 Tax=Aerococcaceae bacterium zg-252 TaxID=2796928 RepID=UPI001A2173CE|nr:response regulator transcription factor [Aerococcaceae bacterium zg-1578]
MCVKLLIVEDELSLAAFIQKEFMFEGYETHVIHDGKEAWEYIQLHLEEIDIILLDWMLPGYDGVTLARRIRKISAIPIIMMTARDQTHDIIMGLDSGIDDYLTKPFDVEVLFARIRVIERRLQMQSKTQSQLNYHGLLLDTARHQVLIDDVTIDLTPKEFGILYELMKEPEVVKTRDDLLNAIWGYEYDGQTNVVDVYIRNLRNKLGADTYGQVLKTVRGVGYVMRNEDA